MVEERICPTCKKKMTYIPEEKSFDGPAPGYYVCYECDYEEIENE